ncbi:phage tail protein [Salmonella enterica subsp. enterica serovar Anatum]|nr:phage tail protein [Salmonella enterica subsp. enterica serovar Anatum]
MSIKNDGHYFCRAGGNRPDGLNEPVTFSAAYVVIILVLSVMRDRCPANPWSITETMSRRYRRWKTAPGRSGRVREDEEGIWHHAVLIR